MRMFLEASATPIMPRAALSALMVMVAIATGEDRRESWIQLSQQKSFLKMESSIKVTV